MTELDNPQPTAQAVRAHGVTHPGRIRQSNEDSMYVDAASGIFVVADGMGGHIAGEVASRMAVESIRDFLERSRSDSDLTWPFGLNTELSGDGNRLATAVRLANRRVFQASESQVDYAGMGTTVVAVIVAGNLATYGGIGDSRLYSFRGGQLVQLTRDDTWVEAVLAQDGNANAEALQHHPMRHVLTEAVGTAQDANPAVREWRLEPGEFLLLCSDGLHTAVPDADIARLLASSGADPEAACATLLEAALQAGARDNVTAVVLCAAEPRAGALDGPIGHEP